MSKILKLSFLILLSLSFAQTNDFETYKKERQRKFEDFLSKRDSAFSAFVENGWQAFLNVPGVSLPKSPASLKTKTLAIPKIKKDENPNIEIINALLKEGVNEKQAASIALEIIDSIGIEAIREGQTIGIATEQNSAKPLVVSLKVDSTESATLLQAKNDGYKYTGTEKYTSGSEVTVKSEYGFPLSNRYRKTDGFGMRSHPILKKTKRHEGVDYATAEGNPVHSVAEGVVIESSFTETNGNYVAIRHKDGLTSYYLHLKEKGMEKGTDVAVGQIIGKVGSTGQSTGPHLHLGIKKNGEWQDPEKILGI